MYIMDPDKLPSKPVISSQRSAIREVENWIKENDLSYVVDGDGQKWRVAISALEKPSHKDRATAIWELVFKLTAELTANDFIDTGVLNAKTDARLLSLIGEDKIPIHMRPIAKTAKSLDEARLLFIDMTKQTRTLVQGKSLIEVKRKLIAQWIDKQRLFSSSLSKT